MLKALLDTWRGRKAERELYDEFVEMLEMGWAVFEMVAEVLSGRRCPEEVEDDVLVQDIAINRKERAIRRRLVEHVSLHSGGAVTSSLILMSVVKDAERIGDYCKNLLEVGQMMEVPAQELRFYKDLMDVSTQVTQNFRITLTAFAEVDEDAARDIIEDETLINRRCDRLIEKIARSDLSAREAVTTVLWVRFLKRINAHLSNICSSLVLPVHRIDYRLSYDKEKSAAGRRKAADDPPAGEQPADEETEKP